MAVGRDWLKTLWKASYKGAPFFVQRDEEVGGRRIVIHLFPMRDDPFLEDLGEDKRDFEVTAYVASDAADSDAASLVSTCAQRGPGVLVLPTHGPILVRCLHFRRARDKDRHGYIAFDLKFVREGASSALVTSQLLANLVFIQADVMAVAAAAAFVSNVMVALQPDYVVDAATSGVQDAVSTLEAIRTSTPVDPAASSTLRAELDWLFGAVPDMLADPTQILNLPTQVIASARALGDGLPPATAASAFEQIITDPSMMVKIADTYPTPRLRTAAINGAEAKRLLLLASVTAYCEAVARVPLADRPAGITLRANVSEYIEAILLDMPPGEIDLYHSIASLRDATVNYLSRAILNLAPVITVEANLSMPSLYWAWRLYQDPNRSTELVARNRVVHPSFMPNVFEALAR